MGNTAGGEEESEFSKGAICRDMSEYQLSLHDGRGEGKKQKDLYVCLNRQIFDVTSDKDNIEIKTKGQQGELKENDDKVCVLMSGFYTDIASIECNIITLLFDNIVFRLLIANRIS